MKNNTCCFFGHREIEKTKELVERLLEIIENLIVKENVDTFLFGSKSQFNGICLKAVTRIKEKYPHIKRVYVRAEYPYINEDYKNHLLKSYEDTYYPESILNSGKAAYVERNLEMINKSEYCIVYYSGKIYNARKSGAQIAFDYALQKGKKIINIAMI